MLFNGPFKIIQLPVGYYEVLEIHNQDGDKIFDGKDSDGKRRHVRLTPSDTVVDGIFKNDGPSRALSGDGSGGLLKLNDLVGVRMAVISESYPDVCICECIEVLRTDEGNVIDEKLSRSFTFFEKRFADIGPVVGLMPVRPSGWTRLPLGPLRPTIPQV